MDVQDTLDYIFPVMLLPADDYLIIMIIISLEDAAGDENIEVRNK